MSKKQLIHEDVQIVYNFKKSPSKSRTTSTANSTKHNILYGNSTKETEDRLILSNYSHHKYNTLKHSKSCTFSNPGERLYLKGLEFKKKITQKVENEIEERKRPQTPEITEMAMNIIRDPSKTFERLYPSHIVNEKQRSKRREKKRGLMELELEDELTLRLYRKKKEIKNELLFDFKPKIDKKSMKILENKGSFFNRLEEWKRKKKSKQLHENELERSVSSNNLYESNNENPSNGFFMKIYKKLEFDDEKNKMKNELNGIYTERAKFLIKLKQEEQKSKRELTTIEGNTIEHKNEEEKENFWKKYNKNQTILKKNYSPFSFYDKQKMWKKNVEKRKEKLKERIMLEEYSNCPFKPELISIDVKDDEKFINKNIHQIVEYVNKRKKSLENEKMKKENIERKYYSKDKFIYKPTVPKGFSLGKERYSLTPQTERKNTGRKIRDLTSGIREFFGFDGTL